MKENPKREEPPEQMFACAREKQEGYQHRFYCVLKLTGSVNRSILFYKKKKNTRIFLNSQYIFIESKPLARRDLRDPETRTRRR